MYAFNISPSKPPVDTKQPLSQGIYLVKFLALPPNFWDIGYLYCSLNNFFDH